MYFREEILTRTNKYLKAVGVIKFHHNKNLVLEMKKAH